MESLGILEGILFVMGDEGIDLKSLCEIMEISEDEAKDLLKQLKKNYEAKDRGLRISYLGDAFKLTTKQEHKAYYEKLVLNPGTNKLSQAALETLAIIAYNQPITRAGIEDIRGVGCDAMIRKLVAKALIKEVGRQDSPGMPILYGVTDEFMDAFSLASLDELPDLGDIVETTSDEDIFDTRYQEKEDKEG